ncbi:hypothetical protein ASPZODRAFT_127024 [Penicilliopsis zonata CBS 506.65]|uniref:Major facilitator superfamily (MFS) profile domain-containing protein n=1 Tax=Penicilliopsis zonata CBS 506.65 TaxID=1073090 RepID=A0A1L9SUX6_9EURO|nr:hypothetical protein ASPZODRAFT_127024 [Penicilliopsis zonata CBS 506.65]OJJ51030.1 hypothetical protein ASPZODRAFT_127024 [Penicilliopsis zonata CBS 506.65]
MSFRHSVDDDPDGVGQDEPLLAADYSRSSSRPSPTSDTMRASSLASFRNYWLASVLCCGGVLFGYDSGVIGGVLTFDSFQNDFRFGAFGPRSETSVSSIGVGIQQAGALVGCFAVWPLTNRLGRRIAMMVCSLIFCIGVILEVINSHSLSTFYVGRVICGLGIGGSATVIPIYMSEMSPKDSRGRMGSCYQLSYTIGILISYWLDYGVKFMKSSSTQWQIPIGMQMLFGALMGLGMLTLEESVRWLLFQGDHERAWKSLTWIRASDSEEVRAEFEEMERGVEVERHATAGFSLQELLEWPNAHRMLLGFGLFLAQQSTGSTALAYFGPQFFSLLVGSSGNKDLLLTGIFGAIKVVACFTFVTLVADRFGRRTLLMSGAAFMAACMLTTAAVVKDRPPPGGGAITSAGIATVALIYLDIIAYNCSWGPLPWPCTSEIFPTRIREPGVAFGVGSQWLFNFVWSFSTPYIMSGIGWATFLLFGVFDVIIVIFVFFCVKETAGKTLEEINALFDSPGSETEISNPPWKGISRQMQPENTLELNESHGSSSVQGKSAKYIE